MASTKNTAKKKYEPPTQADEQEKRETTLQQENTQPVSLLHVLDTNGVWHDVTHQDGKYMYCKDTAFRYGSPRIAAIENG